MKGKRSLLSGKNVLSGRKALLGRNVLSIGNDRGGCINRVIGVVGTSSGCGSTYMSLLVANSLKRLGTRRVICVDMSGNDDFAKICKGRELNGDLDEDMNTIFKYKDVTYSCVKDSDKLIDLFNEDYEHIVIDFGNRLGNHIKEFLRCDIKLVVGLVSPWKIKSFEQYLRNNEETVKKGKWRYIFNLASDMKVRKLRTKYGIKAINVEYEETFFDVKQRNFERIVALLKG